MNRFVGVICFFTVLIGACPVRAEAPGVAPGPRLDLAAAKRQALAGNPGIGVLLARVEAARALVGQSRADGRPHLSAQAGFTWLRDVSFLGGGNLGAFLGGSMGNVPLYSTSVSASWLLFDSFATRLRIKAAGAGAQVSLNEWRDGQRLLAQGVANAFLNCLLADEAGQIATRNATFNGELLEEARKRFKAGSGRRVDVLNFSVRRREAENVLLGAQREARIRRQVLAALLGLPNAMLPENTELIEPEYSLQTVLPGAREAIGRALAQRPDFQAYEHTIEQLQATAAATGRDGWPKLIVQGDYALQRLEDAHFRKDSDATSSASAIVTWDLFDGHRRSHVVSQLNAQRRAATRAREQLKIDIAREIRGALDAAGTASRQAANQADISDMFREIREIVHKEYLSGLSSLTRLNEAQTDLVNAEDQFAQMRIRLHLETEKLAAAMGENMPERTSPEN